jgi:lysine-specific demethylase 8
LLRDETSHQSRPQESLPELSGFGHAFEKCHRAGTPCVLRGVASTCIATRTWTPTWLANHFGELVVDAARLSDGALATDPRRGLLVGRTRLADFADAVITDRASSYVMAPFDTLPSALTSNVEIPAICEAAPFRSSKLWFSPRGAVSPLHFDLAHNLHAQIFGSKRFLLFSSRDSRALYRRSILSGTPNFSAVDPRHPDMEQFPRYRHASPATCTLAPGDMLFLPSRHWHHVTSEAVSISVNFWWARGALAMAAKAAHWWKRARAISR